MIWTVLTLILSLALVVKLVFFTDDFRQQSRGFSRLLLFLLAIYAFSQVLNCLYTKDPASPLSVIFHLALFVGAVMLKPHHLPWNQQCQPLKSKSSSNS